jgi:hypothetical protein
MIGKFKREFASVAVVNGPDRLRGQTFFRCLPRIPDK